VQPNCYSFLPITRIFRQFCGCRLASMLPPISFGEAWPCEIARVFFLMVFCCF
jgi:hypothetical protein